MARHRLYHLLSGKILSDWQPTMRAVTNVAIDLGYAEADEREPVRTWWDIGIYVESEEDDGSSSLWSGHDEAVKEIRGEIN